MTRRFQKKLGRESLSHPAVEGMIRCISYNFMTPLHHGTSSDMVSQICLILNAISEQDLGLCGQLVVVE
jgi:hypothetical protein